MLVIKLNNSFRFILKDETITINKENDNFDKAKEIYNNQENYSEEDIKDLFSNKNLIQKLQNTGFEILNDTVYFNGKIVDETLQSYLLKGLEEDDMENIKNFLIKVEQMPSGYTDASGIYRENPFAEETRQRIIKFVTYSGYPITKEGNFLATKGVRSDRRSSHDPNVIYNDNAIIEMKRYECDHRNNVFCSTGLHVKNEGYVWGGEQIICEIDPRDVVSLPDDYENSKMRCCKLKVIGSVSKLGEIKEQYFEKEKYSFDYPYDEDEYLEEDIDDLYEEDEFTNYFNKEFKIDV